MVELLVIVVDLIALPVQLLGELIATLLAAVFAAMFNRKVLDEKGLPVSDTMAASAKGKPNRWRIFGCSLLAAVILSVTSGLICLLIWNSPFGAQLVAAFVGLVGLLGAVKAALV